MSSDSSRSGLTVSLDSGQAFRWTRRDDGTFDGVAGGRVFSVSDDSLSSVHKGDFLYDYFGMDVDWTAIKGSFSGISQFLDDAMEEFPNLRILRQDPFEVLVSFMISSCNNITRISGIISRLCAAYGDRIDESHFAFPDAEALYRAGEDGIFACGAGFRAGFISAAVGAIRRKELRLDDICSMTSDEARGRLVKMKGIGPKIADCILLFGFGRFDVFPKDVWIKRVLEKKLSGIGEEELGGYRGVAQQFLFMKAREDGLK